MSMPLRKEDDSAAVGDLVARFERLVAGKGCDPTSNEATTRRRSHSCSSLTRGTRLRAPSPLEAARSEQIRHETSRQARLETAVACGTPCRHSTSRILAPLFARWWRMCQWAASHRRLHARSEEERVGQARRLHLPHLLERKREFTTTATAAHFTSGSSLSVCGSWVRPARGDCSGSCTNSVEWDRGLGGPGDKEASQLALIQAQAENERLRCQYAAQEEAHKRELLYVLERQGEKKETSSRGAQTASTAAMVVDIGDDGSDDEEEYFPAHLPKDQGYDQHEVVAQGVMVATGSHAQKLGCDQLEQCESCKELAAKLNTTSAKYNELTALEAGSLAMAAVDRYKVQSNFPIRDEDKTPSSQDEMRALVQQLECKLQEERSKTGSLEAQLECMATKQITFVESVANRSSSEAADSMKLQMMLATSLEGKASTQRLLVTECNRTPCVAKQAKQELEEQRERCYQLASEFRTMTTRLKELAALDANCSAMATTDLHRTSCNLDRCSKNRKQLQVAQDEMLDLLRGLTNELQDDRHKCGLTESQPEAMAARTVVLTDLDFSLCPSTATGLERRQADLATSLEKQDKSQSLHPQEQERLRERVKKLEKELEDQCEKYNQLAAEFGDITAQHKTFAALETDRFAMMLADLEKARNDVARYSEETDQLKAVQDETRKLVQHLERRLQDERNKCDALETQLRGLTANGGANRCSPRSAEFDNMQISLAASLEQHERMPCLHVRDQDKMHILVQQIEHETREQRECYQQVGSKLKHKTTSHRERPLENEQLEERGSCCQQETQVDDMITREESMAEVHTSQYISTVIESQTEQLAATTTSIGNEDTCLQTVHDELPELVLKLERELAEERENGYSLVAQLDVMSANAQAAAGLHKSHCAALTSELDKSQIALAASLKEQEKLQSLHSLDQDETHKQISQLEQELEEQREQYNKLAAELKDMTAKHQQLAALEANRFAMVSADLEQARSDFARCSEEKDRLEVVRVEMHELVQQLERQLHDESGKHELLISEGVNNMATTEFNSAIQCCSSCAKLENAESAFAGFWEKKERMQSLHVQEQDNACKVVQQLEQELKQHRKHLNQLASEFQAITTNQKELAALDANCLDMAPADLNQAKHRLAKCIEENRRLEVVQEEMREHVQDLERELEEECGNRSLLVVHTDTMSVGHGSKRQPTICPAHDAVNAQLEKAVHQLCTRRGRQEASKLRPEDFQDPRAIRHGFSDCARAEEKRQQSCGSRPMEEEMRWHLEEQHKSCTRLQKEIKELAASRDADRRQLTSTRKLLEAQREQTARLQAKLFQAQSQLRRSRSSEGGPRGISQPCSPTARQTAAIHGALHREEGENFASSEDAEFLSSVHDLLEDCRELLALCHHVAKEGGDQAEELRRREAEIRARLRPITCQNPPRINIK